MLHYRPLRFYYYCLSLLLLTCTNLLAQQLELSQSSNSDYK